MGAGQPCRRWVWYPGRRAYKEKTTIISYYLDKFRHGAPLVPHCFWFVQPTPDAAGDSAAPFLETSIEAYKKSRNKWRFLGRGRIESKFVFVTIRARSLTPFFPVNYRLVFMPVIATTNGTEALESAQLLKEGKLYAARWMRDIEQAWKEQQGKEESLFSLHSLMSSCEELSVQHPQRDVVVVFNARGRSLNAALHFTQDTQKYPANGFIANRNTCFYYPETAEEGYYLCSMLNSDVVGQVARPGELSTSGRTKKPSWRPFETSPIPRFNKEDPQHAHIGELGRECRELLAEKAAKAQKAPVVNRRVIQKRMDTINRIAISILDKQG
jgi:hypothetical protein